MIREQVEMLEFIQRSFPLKKCEELEREPIVFLSAKAITVYASVNTDGSIFFCQ